MINSSKIRSTSVFYEIVNGASTVFPCSYEANGEYNFANVQAITTLIQVTRISIRNGNSSFLKGSVNTSGFSGADNTNLVPTSGSILRLVY